MIPVHCNFNFYKTGNYVCTLQTYMKSQMLSTVNKFSEWEDLDKPSEWCLLGHWP